MTRLPDRAEAEEALRANGYVRVGDHSATRMEVLDEIYGARQAAWEKAYKKTQGFMISLEASGCAEG